MSKLIARFACNSYWLGRYVERAENTARIMDITETFARGAKAAPDWETVLDINLDTARYKKTHKNTKAETIIYFYMLDLDNPTSVISTLRIARENARSIRHLISTEMWTQINMFWNWVSGLSRRDIWVTNLAATCGEIKRRCQAFEGISEGTFLRGEAWMFYQTGKYIERADQTTRVLQMGYDRMEIADNDALASIYRDVVLRSVAGYHAFRTRFPQGATQNDVAKFLLFDDEFPRAVALCVGRTTTRLRLLSRRHVGDKTTAIEYARRRLEFELETGLGQRVTAQRLHTFLDDLQKSLGHLSTVIDEAYFN